MAPNYKETQDPTISKVRLESHKTQTPALRCSGREATSGPGWILCHPGDAGGGGGGKEQATSLVPCTGSLCSAPFPLLQLLFPDVVAGMDLPRNTLGVGVGVLFYMGTWILTVYISHCDR